MGGRRGQPEWAGVRAAVAQSARPSGDASADLSSDALSVRELRDAMWLALVLSGEDALPSPADSPWRPAPPAGAGDDLAADRDDGAAGGAVPDRGPGRGAADLASAASRLREWAINARGAVSGRAAEGSGPSLGASSAWPTVPSLPDRRRIVRALRPLMRGSPSPRDEELDEEATAVRAAQDRLWVPECRPTWWHPLEVVLVVDRAGSMAIWQQTAQEFRDLLVHQGAFRDVRLYHADFSARAPADLVLRPETAEARPMAWTRLADPTGRRLVLVLTDAVGEAWHTGAAEHVLHHWGQRMPVAVVHMLEQRLWHWGGLAARRVRLSAPNPGAPNAHLRVSPAEPDFAVPDGVAHGGIPIPVLELSGSWFGGWARLLSAPGAEWVETTAALVHPFEGAAPPTSPVLPAPPASPAPPVPPVPPVPPAGSVPPTPPESVGDDGPPTAREKVLGFRTVASAAAFQLAGLLAAAPLDLPTMKLVQRVLLPKTGLSVLAEVLLGGLLVRDQGDGPPDVFYDFHVGVREELLAGAHRADTVRVARLVAEHAEPGATVLRNLAAALDQPETALPEISPENLRHVRVQEAVFRALSGPYLPRAKRLAARRQELTAGTGGQRGAAGVSTGGGDMTTREQHGGPVQQPLVWGRVPLRNKDFVGREALLEQLRRRLAEGGATAVLPEALHGMGGVGKSQTVVEYLHRHESEYQLVWWVPAEHSAQIKTSFVELARKLGLPAGSADAAVPEVLAALAEGKPYPRWIIVFDNAERPEDLRRFLPTGPGHVVVTSRNADWSGHAHAVQVDLFTRAESIELLHRRGGELAEAEADALAAALGDLPLAIEQAAAWRAQTGMPVVEYLELLRLNRDELIEAGTSDDDQLPVAAAWNVPLNLLGRDHPAALQLLQICAFFGPDPISLRLFRGVRDAPVPAELGEALNVPIKLDRAIREIKRYSLAKIDHRSNTIQLHRLVQAAVKNRLGPRGRENMRHAVHVLLVNGDPQVPEVASNWQRYADLLPHAVASEAIDCEYTWARAMMTNFVKYLLASGDYDGATDLSEHGVEVWRTTLGDDSLETLEMRRLHAVGLRRSGHVQEAMLLNARTYEALRAAVGDDHEQAISMRDVIAADRRSQGRFTEELEIQQDVYRTACRVLGEDDPNTLRYAHNLAGCYRLMGAFDRAHALDAETLERRTAVLGSDHLWTHRSQSALATDLRELGNYEAARAMQDATLRRQRNLLGENHPHTIGTSRNLAVARCRAGDHEGGRELAEDCYTRYRRRYGERHLDSATSLMTLSVDLRHLDDIEGAMEMAERSHLLFAEIHGEDHPHTLIAATNLAVDYRLAGVVEQAAALNTQVTATLHRHFGGNHPFGLVSATNLASDLAALGDHARATELDEDTFRRSATVLGADHPSTLAVGLNLAIDLRNLGRLEESSALQARTVEGLRRVLGERHSTTVLAVKLVRANCDMDTMQL
ncbi:FxSxx-COOH system tetratricopeptide repeat protein [Actinosynnema sp. CS-041913]|uniref:FxSxx-COOH system tetratricopeptide repeat protein n=1 Tax=Actinosynnema sp. CS-041913 TaxID=3239917 RepID=UPI003D8ABCA6